MIANTYLAHRFWSRHKEAVRKRACGTWFRRLMQWNHPIFYQGELLRWIWWRVFFMWSRTGDNNCNKTKRTGEEFDVSIQNYAPILLSMNIYLTKPCYITLTLVTVYWCSTVLMMFQNSPTASQICNNKIFYLIVCSLLFFIHSHFYQYITTEETLYIPVVPMLQ